MVYTFDDWKYKLHNDILTWLEYLGKEKRVAIPVNPKGLFFMEVHIGENAFKSNRHITEVVLPDDTNVIGSFAFAECELLERVEIPSSVELIGEYAFRGCRALVEIDLQNTSIKEINVQTFMNCSSLKSLVLPDTLRVINKSAFSGCEALERLFIPNSVYMLDRDPLKIERENETRLYGCGMYDRPRSHRSGSTPLTFENCPNLTIHTPRDSKAWVFAQEHGIKLEHWDGPQTRATPLPAAKISERDIADPKTITGVFIPESVTRIGSFSSCGLLADISVDESNVKFSSVDGVLYSKDKTVLIRCPRGKTGHAMPEGTKRIKEAA